MTTKSKTPSQKQSDPAPRICKEVRWRVSSAGHTSILRLDNEEFFYDLNGIAAELWKEFDGSRSLSEIKKKVIRKFDPPLERFEKDVASLLDELVRENLVELLEKPVKKSTRRKRG